jgi:hypothetical protein
MNLNGLSSGVARVVERCNSHQWRSANSYGYHYLTRTRAAVTAALLLLLLLLLLLFFLLLFPRART